MYCPVCRAEYRRGFHRCDTCDVALVPTLEESLAGGGSGGQSAAIEDRLVVLWHGRDPVEFSWIADSLAGAGIACHVKRKYVHLRHLAYGDPLAEDDFVVSVFEHDLAAARRILAEQQEHLAEMRQESLAAGRGQDVEAVPDVLMASGAGPADDDVLDWNPAGATVEVWSSGDSAYSKFLRDLLREHRIGYHTRIPAVGAETVLVRPEDEARAREIVRQLLEGAPPV